MRIFGHGVAALLCAVVMFAAGAVVVVLGPTEWAHWTGRVRAESMTQGGAVRHVEVYRPRRLPHRPGLVVDLHPTHADGFYEQATSRLYGQAVRRGWIVAYPDALGEGWTSYGHDRAGVDDVAFLTELIDRLESTDGVDPARVYVMGLSRGGEMAYRLACARSSRVTAIAVVAANMADEHGGVRATGCRPGRPVSVLAIHGTADSAVPLAGGGHLAAFTDVVGYWRELDHCRAHETVTTAAGSTDRRWACAAGTRVRSVVVTSAGHTMPGVPLGSLPWTPAGSLQASEVIADFFAAGRRG